MSIENLLGDIFSGNFTSAKARLHDFLVGSLEPALQAFVSKFLTDEGKLLLSEAQKQASAVLAGTPIKDAASALVADLLAQGVTVAENDALDAIRVHLSAPSA